ncbi:exo1 [Symbiodinium sp. CCMP2456]|nr:exo1 [Symbiodinium sp. CCMP2456]
MARLAPLEDKRAWPALGLQPDQGGQDHEALEDVQRECHVKAVSSSLSEQSLLEKEQPLMLMVGCMLPWQEVLMTRFMSDIVRKGKGGIATGAASAKGTHAKGELRLSEGDFAQAKSCLAQAVEIKDHQIDDVVRLLAAEEVRYIHAPCEADAQMVYLAWHGYVDFCISEDSDLLALGSPRVLYKLRGDGHGREIILDDALNGRSLEDFQAICILMGCDYLPRLRRVGPALAVQVVAARGCEAEAVARELRVLGIAVPSEYAEHFRLASKVLQLQPVYEPRSGRQIPLWSSQEPHAVPVQLASHTGTSAPQETDASCRDGLVPIEAPRGRVSRKESPRRSRSRTPARREGGSGSAFVSDSFEQARSTQQGAMTLEEFIRRERVERTGSSQGAGEHGDGDLACPALSAKEGKSRFFGRQHSKMGSLWSD